MADFELFIKDLGTVDGWRIVDKQNQYGLDAYWKILLTPNAWITPGLQILVDPAFNPTADVVTIPHIKFRVFF